MATKVSGSKDPNNKVLGPKCYNINGIWALNPQYLGPWTLSEGDLQGLCYVQSLSGGFGGR